jgi:hypothetical protein
VKDFLREVNDIAEPESKLKRLKEATDEDLHEFLIHIDEPEFEKLKRFEDRVRAIVTARMDQRAKENYAVNREIDRKTLLILWLTAASVFLAFLALLAALMK